MVKMSNESKEFLEKNIPEVLEDDSLGGVLGKLYDLIDEKGFAPPNYRDYNGFGREAQKVYDDIYLSNTAE